MAGRTAGRFWAVAVVVALLALRPGGAGAAAGAAKIAGSAGDGVGDVARAGAAVFLAAFHVDYEHGCSQSHESVGSEVTMRLALTPSGEAELLLTLEQTTVLGPSFGEFRRGARDFSATRRRERHRFEGRAARSGEGLRVVFEKAFTAVRDLPEYGEAPLPGPTERESSLRLACVARAIPVYEPAPEGRAPVLVEGETPSPYRALLCTPSAPLTGTYHLPDAHMRVEGALPLAREPGLQVTGHSWSGSDSTVVRRVAR